MVDINNPNQIILIKDLVKPIDLTKTMQQIGAFAYAYIFKHKGKIIKIGMSKDNSAIYGERLYRQVANLPGWPTIPVSSCGKDILAAVMFFEQKESVKVHKDDCSVEIWIGSKASSLEDELLTQYEEVYGCLPPGNPKDTRPAHLKSRVRKDVFANLFGITA